MTTTSNDTFKQVIPIHLIKGKDKKGNVTMKMRGIASTTDKDDDGEFLDPAGFQLDYFLKYGFMNWNHQAAKDPTALIGRPTAASLNKSNQLIIDFNLFTDSEKAKQVYQLQQVLEKEGLALGLSIEGDVIERGSKDKNHPDYAKVKKARITGCAVCPNPKNASTVAQIIKGNKFNSLSAYENEDEDTQEKALSVQSDSGQALAKESLNSSTKVLEYGKNMKKAVALKKIFLDLPTISSQQGEQIYNLVETIQKSISMDSNQAAPEVLVSEEAINKAYETLGLQKGNTATPVAEQAPAAPAAAAPAEGQPEEQSAAAPAATTEEPTKEELLARKEQLQKSIQEIDTLLEPQQAAPAAAAPAAPAIETPVGDNSELIKGITTLMTGAVSQIEKNMNEKFGAMGTLYKGMQDQLNNMQTEMKDMDEALKQPIQKSILTQNIVDKNFAGQEELKKSIEGGEMKAVSIRANKRAICDTLTKAITATGSISDQQLANDIMLLESAGQATPYLVEKAREHKIALIP